MGVALEAEEHLVTEAVEEESKEAEEALVEVKVEAEMVWLQGTRKWRSKKVKWRLPVWGQPGRGGGRGGKKGNREECDGGAA